MSMSGMEQIAGWRRIGVGPPRQRWALLPPTTGIDCPVILAACSEQRNVTKAAISSGRPIRLSGMFAVTSEVNVFDAQAPLVGEPGPIRAIALGEDGPRENVVDGDAFA